MTPAIKAAKAQAKADAIQNIDGSQKPVGFKPKGGDDVLYVRPDAKFDKVRRRRSDARDALGR